MPDPSEANSGMGNHLQQDEVVRELVPDPGNPPETRMLVGLLGASSRKGYSRLYLSLNLSDYIEIPEGDVLWAKSLQTPENPLGGSAVWVHADSELVVIRRAAAPPPPTEVVATAGATERFLTGSITARFFTGASASSAAPGIFAAGGGGGGGGGGLKSVPPVESCVPSLCLPPPPPPDPPGHTAVCTLSTRCSGVFF